MRGKIWQVVVALGLSLAPVHAQAPQRITATYDDWTVSCVAPPNSNCELVEAQMMKGKSSPVGQITISRAAKDKAYKIFFQVPANAWLQTGIKFVAQANQAPLLAQFRWCLPSRCLADAELTEALVGKFGSYTTPGNEQYKNAEQHDMSLSVSFKGFRQALDWMQSQSK